MNLHCDILVSKFAFKCNSYRYNAVLRPIDLKSTLSNLWKDVTNVQNREEAEAVVRKGAEGMQSWWKRFLYFSDEKTKELYACFSSLPGRLAYSTRGTRVFLLTCALLFFRPHSQALALGVGVQVSLNLKGNFETRFSF